MVYGRRDLLPVIGEDLAHGGARWRQQPPEPVEELLEERGEPLGGEVGAGHGAPVWTLPAPATSELAANEGGHRRVGLSVARAESAGRGDDGRLPLCQYEKARARAAPTQKWGPRPKAR